ncbi:hypothetical protein [Lentzea flaviverrucosa]|uniref:Uncharacterized protein n=1 Tax=Lentzea flaviverrucosa TaxID=200379 RepID=A0A1H9WT09_9PSEU|nr:hypothetical protein [Lentzea flaviverrucosa]RDI23078.1 hypothetical protein DFR72_111209 [Lentzea flaviverrucosa]SES37066.1 hypothetical protein SAMN05216195_112203 [Lentzea flaviverrucosa]
MNNAFVQPSRRDSVGWARELRVWQVMAAQLLHATVISLIMGVGITYFQSLDPGRRCCGLVGL